MAKLHSLLRSNDIPNAVTGEEYELRVDSDRLDSNIWKSRDRLLMLRKQVVLFVLEVPKSA